MWKKQLIEKLGGYATIGDAIEAIRAKDLKERYAVLTLAVKKLFNTIGPDDILRSEEGQWHFQGKTLSKGEQDLIIAEAVQFENSLLWKVLQKDVLHQVNRKMYLKAENEMHVVTSKFWLYTFDTIRTRLQSLAKGSPQYNSGDKH